jgi:hypothetical protein
MHSALALACPTVRGFWVLCGLRVFRVMTKPYGHKAWVGAGGACECSRIKMRLFLSIRLILFLYKNGSQ